MIVLKNILILVMVTSHINSLGKITDMCIEEKDFNIELKFQISKSEFEKKFLSSSELLDFLYFPENKEEPYGITVKGFIDYESDKEHLPIEIAALKDFSEFETNLEENSHNDRFVKFLGCFFIKNEKKKN